MQHAVVFVSVTAAALCVAWAGERVSIGKLGRGEVADIVENYQLWDAMTNDGKGHSDAKTSGGLGWGESTFVRNYMMCYFVTHDPYWLDKVVDHFDRMVSNLSDPEGNGYLAWSTAAYSVGIAPALQRPHVKRGLDNVTGHDYSIEFTSPTAFVVRDLTDKTDLATHAYKPPQKVTDVPRAEFTIKGAAKAGAKFTIQTMAPEHIEYQVHDGMVTYPVAQFIEVVSTTPALHPRYLAKAQQYTGILAKHFLQKWEPTWLDLPDGSGLYKFTKHATQRFPDTSLPHNQFLALGRTWLVLQAVPGLAHREQYLDRATRMARYFKQNLRRNGRAYVWHYWDPLPHEDVRRHIEDRSHATIDIGFAVEARDRGIVFADEDLSRFAATYVDVMWNGDKQRPLFGRAVNTNAGGASFWWEWIQLARADQRVWDLVWAIFVRGGRQASAGPAVACVYNRLVGVDEAERAECRRRSATVIAMMKSAGQGPFNTGFEIGAPGSSIVPGWTLTTWGPDQGGEAKCVAGGYRGEQSVALIGKGPKVNVIALCQRRVHVAGKATCVIKAHYKTVGPAKPAMSVLGYGADGKRLQYTTSPGFAASADWAEARWPAAIQKGVELVEILLRNAAPGTVYWDEMDVATE